MIENIIAINNLIGMPVLSRTSGNKFGHIQDIFVDPVKGLMLGLIIESLDGGTVAVEYKNIFSFGNDAVMANNDKIVKAIDENGKQTQPFAKRNILGTNIITESGNELGKVADILIHLAVPPFLIYELRESVFDKLLGRSLFILGQTGRAFSNDSERIVVSNESVEIAASNLEDLITQKQLRIQEELKAKESYLPPDAITVRTFGEEETIVRDRGEEETLVKERENNLEI